MKVAIQGHVANVFIDKSNLALVFYAVHLKNNSFVLIFGAKRESKYYEIFLI